MYLLPLCCVALCLSALDSVEMEVVALTEKQLTHAAQSHDLDSNDNFSPDGRYLCYDSRETVGPGIEHGQTIEVLDLETERCIIVYKPEEIVHGDAPAPGVGAVSFSPAAMEMAFIHGPLVAETPERGAYARSNRNGARVMLDGEVVERDGLFYLLKDGRYNFSWLDKRDAARDRDTLPGAHRGGTHRHEYCRTGTRIGFTYDDHLLPQYDRTVGYMEAHPQAPAPASHYFAVLVPVALRDQARPGEIEKAYGDSWVDAAGLMRAFIGKVRNPDGESYEESLFVVDIPAAVRIDTADSGGPNRYPSPPAGTRIRRLTHDWAGGIVRGAPEGDRIAYYGKDDQGVMQLFIIPALGSDKHPSEEMRPIQATRLPQGAESGLRWHPNGNALICISDGGLVVTCVKPGPDFGKSVFVTPHGDGADRHAPVLSPSGDQIAYNRHVPVVDAQGAAAKNYAGKDFNHIFMVDLTEQAEALAEYLR